MDRAATEITLLQGSPVVVQGEAKTIETAILNAARGSIMELVWLTESGSGTPVGINPEYVVSLRPSGG